MYVEGTWSDLSLWERSRLYFEYDYFIITPMTEQTQRRSCLDHKAQFPFSDFRSFLHSSSSSLSFQTYLFYLFLPFVGISISSSSLNSFCQKIHVVLLFRVETLGLGKQTLTSTERKENNLNRSIVKRE